MVDSHTVKNSLRSIFFFVVVLQWIPFAEAKVYGLFDFDGTIARDRGTGAAWITPWLLKRVQDVHSTIQQVPNQPIQLPNSSSEVRVYLEAMGQADVPGSLRVVLPEQIGISYDEFRRLEPKLAQGNAILNGLHPVLLDHDPVFPNRPRLIIPGYYHVFDHTFKYYRESTGLKRKNYLLRDYESARARMKIRESGYSWKGEAFALFQAFMGNAETVSNAQVFTSRGHGSEDYLELWDRLAQDGEIQFSRTLQGTSLITHSFGRPDSRVFGRSLTEKKVKVVAARLESIYHSAADSQRHEIQDASGLSRYGHTLIVAEDDPTYVENIANFLLDASGNYFADKVELALLNTGTPEEVEAARFPYRWTRFEPGRRALEVTPNQIAQWIDPSFHKFASGFRCNGILAP